MDRSAVLSIPASSPPPHLSPEDAFALGASLDRRKKLGQFFTPAPIARTMVGWCCRDRPCRLLDPAIGPGIFPACALELSAASRPGEIAGYDIDADTLNFARVRLAGQHAATIRLQHADFLSHPPPDRFDAVVCNPPYIRHHDAEVATDVYRELESVFGIRLSRMTNVYALFLLRIATLLSERGRAAVITPAEFLNADFGVAVKTALMKSGILRGFVIFDHASSVFEGIMTTAAITLLDATRGSTRDVRLVHVDAESDLVDALDAMDDDAAARVIVRTRPDPAEKWATGARNAAAVDPSCRMRSLSDFATCSRGIATGANGFFSLTRDEARKWELPDTVLRPCVMKAPQVPGSHWTNKRMDALIDAGKKSLLLDAARHPDDPAVQRYVDHGESQGLHQRYLTRHRKPWFAIERREPADIWVATFGRGRIRFVWNQSTALHLTAFHGLYLRPAYQRFAIHLMAYLHSDAGAAECSRNQRVYGDGLLKFEPRDVERLRVPDFESMPDDRLASIENAGLSVVAADGLELPAKLHADLRGLFETASR